MAALETLFQRLTLVVVEGQPQAGGMPLPAQARIVPLRSPVASDFRRKVSVLAHLGYYLRAIAAETRKADVVHSPVPGDIALLGMLVALVQRKRLVGLYNGSWVPNSQSTITTRITRRLMRACAGGRNLMLAVGDGDRQPAADMHWLFATSLTRSEFGNGAPNLDRRISSPPRLVYAGRLSVEKGVPYLVHALARLKAEGFQPLPRCLLLGDGPQRGEVEELVRQLDLSSLVKFGGQVERLELGEQLGDSDLCVHPSLTEGFCKAWLDAMAHGLPVLTTEVGAARAVIGPSEERGWLVPPGDSAALASALRKVIGGPVNWPELRRRCYVYAMERTLEEWGKRIGDLCAAQWGLTTVEGKLAP
jgi:glycosyltransferase involved in cell wall biosynthesis